MQRRVLFAFPTKLQITAVDIIPFNTCKISNRRTTVLNRHHCSIYDWKGSHGFNFVLLPVADLAANSNE